MFDDFIAAAEWLIDNKYTSPEKLAIRGGSNGGLLVGACMTQRPDLFARRCPGGRRDGHAPLSQVHHRLGLGRRVRLVRRRRRSSRRCCAYSPLHNLKPGTKYPATLVTTADHDDRVVPAHSFKFAAALAGRPGRRHAGAHPHRNPRRPRRRHADDAS